MKRTKGKAGGGGGKGDGRRSDCRRSVRVVVVECLG